MSFENWMSLLFVIGFMIIHAGSRYLELTSEDPRSSWLSIANGATVAYLFLFLFPELNTYHETIKKVASDNGLGFFSNHTYLLALLGLLLYYGLDIAAKSQKLPNSSVFFIFHLFFFFLYNMVIGYIMVRGHFSDVWGMTIYFLALAGHFGAADYSLKEIHKKAYDRYGRWILTAAIFIGWLIGVLFKVNEVVMGISVSLLAGGILFNAFNDEIREGTFKNYLAFLAAAVAIAVLFIIFGR